MRWREKFIVERGPEALSISEVARRADLNRTTAHSHFPRRSDLVAAVKERSQLHTIEMLSVNKPLGEWVDHLVGQMANSPGMNRLSIHDLLEDAAPNREGWDRYTAWIQEIAKEEGVDGGPAPEFMAQFLMAIVLMWPLLANVHYEESELPAARKRLASEIKLLLAFGFVDPERSRELMSSLGAAPYSLSTSTKRYIHHEDE